MAVLLTLTVGAMGWMIVVGTTDSAYTMGQGGPVVYAAVLVFVGVAAVRALAARRSMDTTTSARKPWLEALKHVGDASIVGGIVVIAIGTVFGFQQVGDTPVSGWVYGLFVMIILLPVAAVVIALGRAAHSSSGHSSLATRTRATIRRGVSVGLAPMLGPLLTMLCLAVIAGGTLWETRMGKPVQAGLIYYAMLPLVLPTAVIVAWGIDRLDGSTAHALSTGAAFLGAGLLAVGIAGYPHFMWGLYESRIAANGVELPMPFLGVDLYIHNLRHWRPFSTSRPIDGSGTLPLDGMFRGVCAMLFVASVSSALMLRRIGRVCAHTRLLLTLVLVCIATQVLLAVWLIPALGPEGGAWASVLGWSPLLLHLAWTTVGRRSRSTAA